MTVHLIHTHTQPIYAQHKAGAESKVHWPFSPSLATILNELDEWQVAPTLLPWQPQCSQLGQSQAMWIDDLLDAHTCLIVYIIHYCTYFQASTQYRIVFTVSILKGFQASHMMHRDIPLLWLTSTHLNSYVVEGWMKRRGKISQRCSDLFLHFTLTLSHTFYKRELDLINKPLIVAD